MCTWIMLMNRNDETSEFSIDASNAAERRTLVWVLGINLTQVVLAGAVGVLADSVGLLGAAFDNLADAAVYIVSLYAVGRSVVAKARAARLSGVLLILVALGLLAEILRRYFGHSEPIGLAMIVAAFVNAGTNVVCLRLLRSQRERGVHLKASWIFTTNDMLANAGIVLSGVAVMYFQSPLPDLLIGLVTVELVLHGAWEILESASEARQEVGTDESQPSSRETTHV